MARPRMRPVFERPMHGEPSAFLASLQQALARSGGRPGECRGQVFGKGAILRLCDAECRVWSPALHLAVEPLDGEAGSDGRVSAGQPWRLRGTFSPSSPVWTAFVAIYLALACVGIGAGCWGGAQLIMKEPPWAFVGVPIALLLSGFTYGAAFIGQGLGAEDMYTMRTFVEHLADEANGTTAGA
ncbi:MAG: hypothetical protein JNL12_23010 [Planctomycetes bacterium]|nr:hypothetical protein [Planctomycetota bacterium]